MPDRSFENFPEGLPSRSPARAGNGSGPFGFRAQPPFQFRHPFEQFRQLAHGDELPLHFLVGLRGRTQPFAAGGNIRHHPGLPGDDYVVTNFQVSRDARLSGKDDVVAQLNAARDSDL